MQSIFGASTDQIQRVLLAISAAVLLTLLVAALRRRTLLWIGLRNAARRPVRGVVIIAGLMLSTVVISTAFATGDAMTSTVRSLVTGNTGDVDEIITAPQRDFTQIGNRNVENLTSGSFALVPSNTLPETEFDSLAQAVAVSRTIRAMTPAYLVEAPVADQQEQLAHPGVGVLGLSADLTDPFALHDASGGPVNFAGLGPGDVLINQAAAKLLSSGAGRTLRVYLSASGAVALSDPAAEHDVTVVGVVANGGVVGSTPTVFMPLFSLQQALGQEGRINEILVINRCGGDPVPCSQAATTELRRHLVDPQGAEILRAALAGSNGRSVLHGVESRRSGRGHDQVVDLEHAVAMGRVTDHLLYILGDPQVAGTLQAAAAFLPTSDGRAVRTLRTLNRLTVVEVKRSALDQASDYGSTLTSVFLVLGLFSIAASLLLVFLVFVMLAAERRTELGVSRAIGLRRSHLVQSFTFEGMVYDLGSAVLGAALGIGVSALIVTLVSRALHRYGIAVQQHVESRSVVIAFCLGLLVTLITVVVSAWRVSRLNIVEAIRGVAFEPPLGRSVFSTTRERLRWMRASSRTAGGAVWSRGRVLGGHAVSGGLALVWSLGLRGVLLLPPAVGLLLLGRAQHRYAVFGLGVSATVAAGALALRWLLLLCSVRAALTDRLAASVTGFGWTVFWALPAERWHLGGAAVGVGSIETFAVAGVFMVLGTVLVVAYNIAGPLRLIAGLLGRGGPGTTAVRMAVAYPLQHRFRTGMAVAMFSLVVFTMVVAAVLLDSAERAYIAREQPPGGYDISASAPAGAGFDDMRALLGKAPASSVDEFAGIGSLASTDLQVLDLQGRRASWSSLAVRLADQGMLLGTPLKLSARANGYGSDAAVWQALAQRAGTAVVSRGTLAASRQPPVAVIDNVSYDQRSFDPFAVWMRDGTASPVRLTVLGVVDDLSVLPFGMLTLRANVPFDSAQSAQPTTFLFRTADGRDPSQAATGLDLSFGQQGLRTSVVGEGLRNVQTLRRLLNYLLEGFVGLGLASGMAALGVISTRTVVERRQEIGMLRAIGVRRRLVQISFLLEVSLIAVLGVAVGVCLGLLLSSDVVGFLRPNVQEMRLTVPWAELGLIALVAYCAAMTTTLAAAWQAGRVEPAEALRYE